MGTRFGRFRQQAAMRIDLVQNLGNRPAAPGLDRADGQLGNQKRRCQMQQFRPRGGIVKGLQVFHKINFG